MRFNRQGLITLFIILAALLLVACGTDDKLKDDLGKQADKQSEAGKELPDMVPDDFPFPDSMKISDVVTTEPSEGMKIHMIGFTHSEDKEELYNVMKTYMEDKGCDGSEVSGQYICSKYTGDENLKDTKINIGDPASTVQFVEMSE